jgi:STE24 endopeptidase
MQVPSLTLAFATALLLSLAVKFWLATRQMRHVAAHRAQVPPAFAATVTLESHQKAADYTLAKGRLGLLSTAFGSALLLGWTLLGGLDLLNGLLLRQRAAGLGANGLPAGAAGGLHRSSAALIELPLEWYSTFRIEQRFGFNRMTLGLWLADMAKGAAVGAR